MSTATATATRTATITNNRADLHQFFTNPTGILATSSIARAIVSALTKITDATDDIYFFDNHNWGKGFVYQTYERGITLKMKRHGDHRTKITIYKNWNTPNHEIMESYLIDQSNTLDTFIELLDKHTAK